MNELKENIVILNRDDYDKLQENLIETDRTLDEILKLFDIFENYFWEDFYNRNRYTFVTMKKADLQEYNFESLLVTAIKLGITDVEYITKKIIEYKEKFTEKGEKNE